MEEPPVEDCALRHTILHISEESLLLDLEAGGSRVQTAGSRFECLEIDQFDVYRFNEDEGFSDTVSR